MSPAVTPTGFMVPAARHRIELVERRSRFVATVERTPTDADARAFIEEMRTEHPHATHHVYAFAVGHGATVTHGMSDDGEPSGTAGRPVLAVVQGSGLGDVSVVVTRYFGGTKLGTGGLVRAYSAAAQGVLAEVPRSVHDVRLALEMEVPYALYESCSRLIAAHEGRIESERFEACVVVRASFRQERLAAFHRGLADVSAGQVVARDVADAEAEA